MSSWPRLVRILARVLRWLPTVRERVGSRDKAITGSEVLDATKRLVRHVQEIQFPEEIAALRDFRTVSRHSPLASLNPFVDADGLLRVGGRLAHSELDPEAKHPIILRAHHITRIIVEDEHRRALHGGVNLTLATLRSQYWVLQGRKIVRSVIFHCISCARLKADVGRHLMSDLPSPRVCRPNRPFTHCGLDYAGPVAVRRSPGRGVRSSPAYIAIFICLAVKAVHVEVVSDYTSQAFLAAFRRFCARRGRPSHIYSDRGTTFVGADRELRQALLHSLNDPAVQTELADDGISWHFNPPAAPHFGGIWEAAVKSLKTHLKKILVTRTPTFEELTTLTAQVEACLNSRPFAPLRDSGDDLDALTPAHFLVGGPIVGLPQPSLLDVATSRLSRWQLWNQLLERFWRRWSDDYVQSFQSRSKWRFEREPLRVG